MLQPGTLLQERFLIEERIGSGGMGAVYLATDQKFGSKVAIKETFYENRELAEAFEREARLLNSLHHPVLPHVSDHFSNGDESFLVMEYIEGEDLSEVLNRGDVLSSEEVIRWTFELLDALDYLHSQQPPIVHRDIKPNNLKVTTRGNIVLLDFGLAKETSGNTLGMKSVFGYSRRYSPLEQIEGTGTDTRSDLFALGATVFHLLTGQPPIDVLARASAIVAGRPDPLLPANEVNANVPADFANIIHASLALNADGRFVSAGAMRTALQAALGINDVREPSERADNPPLPVVAAAAIAAPAASESFAALDAFKDDSRSAADEAPPIVVADEASPIIVADEFITKVDPPFRDPVPVPAQSIFGRYAALRPAVWLIAIIALASILGYGIYNSGASDAASRPTDEQPASTEVHVGDTSAAAVTSNELPAAKPEQAAPKIEPEVSKPEAAKTTAKKAAGNQEQPEPETQAKAEQPKPQTKPVSVPRQPQRRTATRDDAAPSVSDIERILTGVPAGSDRSNDAERERWVEDERYRRRQERRNNRRQQQYPPF